LENGKLKFAGIVGKDITTADAQEAAKTCAVNCLSVIKSAIGDLEKIERIVKLTVFVASVENYTDQPKVGFDWEKKENVWEKVKEEIKEFEEVSNSGNQEKIEEELGDLLFSIVNYTRFIGINPENALRVTNEKFIKRFNYIEEKLNEEGKKITDSNLTEMDKLWEESKDII